MTVKLELIQPQDLTDADIRWLAKGCQGSHDNNDPLKQVEAALNGDAGIHRITGDAEGIIVLNSGPDFWKHHTLTITAIAGKNMICNFNAVCDAVRATAAASGAVRLNGYVTRAGLTALYKRRAKMKMVQMFYEDVL